MMTDIHSHDPQMKPEQNKVLSLLLHPETNLSGVLENLPSGLLISAGIHPWNASEWSIANMPSLEAMLHSSRIAFIGEIGLDNACGVPLEEQLFVFEKQLQIADEMRKSVLIHNVGHQAELIALKSKYKRIPAWVLHGFRGKAQTTEQFLKCGFYISFGLNHQKEALHVCPLDRLFLETDESNTELESLYQKVAKELGLSAMELESSISRNLESICLK
jgi:TatD DNase family protein